MTPRQFFARWHRHAERQREREQTERIRLGMATAALMNLRGVPREGARNWWDATDVFPDLTELWGKDDGEQDEDEMVRALMQFPGARRVHEA